MHQNANVNVVQQVRPYERLWRNEKLEISGNQRDFVSWFSRSLLDGRIRQRALESDRTLPVGRSSSAFARTSSPMQSISRGCKGFRKISRERWKVSSTERCTTRDTSLRQTRQENLSDVTSRTFWIAWRLNNRLSRNRSVYHHWLKME